ncbi:CBS domain-containing protein [Candidatus Saccharibacteria bacterium]|nr:CBS domain-containing protein [Candidatus Saccharibacteria bacterium]
MWYALIWIILVILSALRFQPKIQFSTFERNRLLKKGESAAILEARELEQNVYMKALREIIVSISIVWFVYLVILEKPGAIGLVIAFVGIVLLPVIARLKPFLVFGQLVERRTRKLLEELIEPIKPFLSPWKTSISEPTFQINSKDELMALVEGSNGFMTRAELSRLKANLRFDSLKVDDILTPRKDVVAISKDEVLGPLVLDEMYKTGHSRFPVYDQDIDHVVGILHLQDIVDVTVGQKIVEDAMRRPVMVVNHDQNLSSVLNLFVKKHQHLAVVTNDRKKMIGVVSLEDVFAELIGQDIADDLEK